MHSPLAWGAFLAFVAALLALDLFGFNRKAHAAKIKEAGLMSAFWIAVALAFGGFVYWAYGAQSAMEYYTGWMIEKALSVDNLFVFAAIFGFFNVPREYRHRVLFWGILSAIVMRFIFIYAGAWLVNLAHWPLLLVVVWVAALSICWFTRLPRRALIRWPLWLAGAGVAHWAIDRHFGGNFESLGILGHQANAVLTFFALILLASAWKLYKSGDEEAVEPDKNSVVKWVSKLLPVHKGYEGTRFLVKKPDASGKLVWMFTPLLIVLVAVEVTDLMFATDSIPAIFAVSKDPFILFTSNIMAILGLRALYFLLESTMHEFAYLKKGLVLVLGFVGVKMLIADFYHIPIGISLAVVALVIIGSIVLSVLVKRPKKEEDKGHHGK